MNRSDDARDTLGVELDNGGRPRWSSKTSVGALALVAAGALLIGCGGVGDEDGFAVEGAETGAALNESTCNTTTNVDAFVLARNFPTPGNSIGPFTTLSTYGSSQCTRAHVLDVHEPATGTNNITVSSTYGGTRPTTKAACEAIRLSTRFGDSITPMLAARSRPGTWTGTSCTLPTLSDGFRDFVTKARHVSQATDAAGQLVRVRFTITHPR